MRCEDETRTKPPNALEVTVWGLCSSPPFFVSGRMIAVGGLDLPPQPQKSPDERLSSLERELDHLKAGLGLLGVKPCSCCANYYRSSDPGALFHGGELVCYNCIPQWWLQRSPKLSTDDRQQAERDLRRWLVSHHRAEVIGRAGDLPAPERLLMKLVTGCEQCNSSGKTDTGKRCSNCDGRGTVWLVVRDPDSRLRNGG